MTRIILEICEKLVYLYIFLISLRIVCSWLGPAIDGRASKNVSKLWHYLCLITGPYLALFRGFKMFRTKAFDYTPFIAIFTLLVASHVIGLFTIADRVTFGAAVIILVLAIWAAIRIILISFLVLCAVRLAGLVFREGTIGKFFSVIDLALQPLTELVLRITHKRISYQTILFLCIGALAVICVAGSFSFQTLYNTLVRI